MSYRTLTKADFTVKNVDARLTAIALQLSGNDVLGLSNFTGTRNFFRDSIVPNLKQTTVDSLIEANKNKQGGSRFLEYFVKRFTEENVLTLAKSASYPMLLEERRHWHNGSYDTTPSLINKYPQLKPIIKNEVFVNQGARLNDVDAFIEKCLPEEFDQYKDYEQFRRRIAEYSDTPVYLLEYYKDYLKDTHVLRSILEKQHDDASCGYSKTYAAELFRIQKHIAITHANFCVARASGCDLPSAWQDFITRHAAELNVTIVEK